MKGELNCKMQSSAEKLTLGIKRAAVVPILLLFLAFCPPSSAGETGPEAAAPEHKEEISGEMARLIKAYDSLKKSELSMIRKMPAMTARRVVLVREKPPYYGAYNPRADNIFRRDEPILVYLEPIGYTVLTDEHGLFHFALTADFAFHSEEGEILGAGENVSRWKVSTREVMTEFHIVFTYTGASLTPGKYVIDTVVRDVNSEKKLRIRLPIVVAE